jgi:uroporphyrinogen III methyltransferase/synthase
MSTTLIGIGPGDASLIGVRAVEVIAACDELVVDGDVADSSWRTRTRSDVHVSRVAQHRDAQAVAREAMVEASRAGRSVARVRSGEGWASSEALRDLRALEAAGIECDVVAGAGADGGMWRAWLRARPLYGRCVVITRMRGQADATAELLRAHGAEPWSWPAIEIALPPEPWKLQEAVAKVGDYQVVTFTSANGVERFFEALSEAGRDARGLANSRVAAIGPATAEALRTRGIRADIVAKDYRGEALAEAILDACKAMGGQRVLIPRALEARDVLPDTLRAAGMVVDVVPAYETRAVERSTLQPMIEGLGRGHVDAILLTSSSTVTSLVKAIGEDRALLGRTDLASIGPITTKTAQELGLKVAVTASSYTVPALIAALEQYWG